MMKLLIALALGCQPTEVPFVMGPNYLATGETNHNNKGTIEPLVVATRLNSLDK